MFRDVTVGQYYSADSILHRIDPRVKIRFTIIYIVLLLLDRNLFQFLLLTAVFGIVFALGKIPAGYVLKGSKGIYIFIAVCSAINIFTTPGTEIVSMGSVVITEEGLIKAGFVLWRMVLIILISSMLMYTTTPSELTDGLEKSLMLNGSIAMSITIALRFVPVLFGELQTIMRAQEARGAVFNEGGPVRRIKSLKTVIIPLFQGAINKAANLGDAMDARCYTGGKQRTKLNPLMYKTTDIIAYIITLLMVVTCVWLIVRF